MIAITAPTGHIGSQLVRLLLAADERVRVVVRNPDKLPADVRDRVEYVAGSSDDEGVLSRALAGADGLFHCVPPVFGVTDTVAHYLQFTRPAIAAMKATGVKRVVTVSALGRGLKMTAGVVSAAHRKDVALEEAGLDVRALWCPGFMENTFMSAATLKSQGMFFGPSRPEVRRPYVATRDIAEVAARLLRDRSWSGPGGVGVLGPEDLTIHEMAAILTDVLGRPIRYQQVPAEGYKAQLMQHGASEHFAQGLIDMHDAKDNGLDTALARTPENTTPTTFRTWCREVLAPALAR
jgi:uncharacterized protein YbjT (DUF2867 family)